MIVLYRTKLAILLVDKEEGASHGGLERVDIATPKVVRDIIFQGNCFARCEAID